MTDTPSTEISLAALRQRRGAVIGISDWYTIDQRLIERFADITRDRYFIHVDPERARRESPYGGTIAHGALILSLLSDMAARSLPTLRGLTGAVNYGFDAVRFLAPVRSGARVRAHFTLSEASARSATQVLVRYRVSVEIEDHVRHALVADWLSLVFVADDGADGSRPC